MSVAVFLPTGVQMKFPVTEQMTVSELKEKAADMTRRSPGFMCVRADDVRLTVDGKTLENSAECKFLPSTVVHLVLKVHGG